MKILLYKCEDELAPVGGPFGYLYNVKKYRDEIGDNEILFKKNVWKYNKNFFDKIIGRLEFPHSAHARHIYSIFKKKVPNMLTEFNNYDIVHFHTTEDMFRERENLKSYNGLVVLTSHSPKVTYKEYIEDIITEQEYSMYKNLFDSAEQIDEYAFKRADYIFFPCMGAEEPYYHSWPKYNLLRDESKIRYVPTGIVPVACKKSREEVRKELNIPEDAILLSFVGRHNEVKGYDILQSIFSKLENIFIVCCGNVGSIHPPKSDRWIEIGWTADPYSYVGASDIYMLPNRETYFDIAMLQTLSIGKCSVISNTGGNKEFINTPGVKLFDTVDEAVNSVNYFINMKKDDRSTLESYQRGEFKEKYNIDVFYKTYKKTLNELLGKDDE
ncbi:glycosyltransferase family 4 protein [Oribacterium sp. WCC10]|uniref:glycosyltransferase family 4 protein n=1 Tax=Oribacterium sp. WCC10 TaxID=1855343 RepID=UPI0008E83F5C|nr:glycosyltransferase family 4 protein [Oribacterium sp. WCC10]SFG80536.1 Glycosyltransferase involved in cell wall bisynthesis [Oribacterium sp. WCC10]